MASAQLDVTSAQEAVADTKLRAPAAGTVASISGAVGDTVSGTGSSSSSGASPSGSGGTGAAAGGSSSSTGFITLARVDRLHLEVSLTESDIGKVKVGQAATVTVNAASGQQVAAHVSSVSVLSSSSSSSTTGSSSAVSYPVTLVLDQTAKGLKPGMSASADIVTAQASGLVVPTQAISGSTVVVDEDGKRTTTRVTTGLAGDTTTQILSGLTAGQTVIVTSTTATSTPTGSSSGTSGRLGQGGGGLPSGGFGGGGFPSGGPPAGAGPPGAP